MANLTGVVSWDAIKKIDIGDKVGPAEAGGVSNDPHQNLMNRTEYLINNLSNHKNDTSNPHQVTTGQIGAETPAGAEAKAYSRFNVLSTAGVLDWNDPTNCEIPGAGTTLLRGNVTNGPGSSGYFYPVNYLYAGQNITQFAIPYTTDGNAPANMIYYRNRHDNVWAPWVCLETQYGAQAKVDTHNAVTNPHGATYAATASRLMIRDASGRAQVGAPSSGYDCANKSYVDAHANLTNPHSATPLGYGDRLMLRDSYGRCQVVSPSANADIARLDTVNNAVTTHNNNVTNPHGATALGTPGRLMLRDSVGRCQVATPYVDADIARFDTVKNEVTAHNAVTNPHSATAAPTGSRLMLRDSYGRCQVAAPVSSAQCATKGYVDDLSNGHVKAWAKIDASSGTPTIKASNGISSLTDVAAGDIQINFATAFPTADSYAVAGSAKRLNDNIWGSNNEMMFIVPHAYATTYVRIFAANAWSVALYDAAIVNVIITAN